MILSPFEHILEKSGETVSPKLLLSTTFLMSKLLKYSFLVVLSNFFLKISLLIIFESILLKYSPQEIIT